VKPFLDIQLQSGKYIRDLIRHLRVYLCCDTILVDAIPDCLHHQATARAAMSIYDRTSGISYNATMIPPSLKEPVAQAIYRSRLDGLPALNYADHKVTLQICVFYTPVIVQELEYISSFVHTLMKPVFYEAKNAGAHVAVRWEDFSTGRGGYCTAGLLEDVQVGSDGSYT
jgi:hypothetical protein